MVAINGSIGELASFGLESVKVGVGAEAGHFSFLKLAFVAAAALPLQVTFFVPFVIVPVARVAFVDGVAAGAGGPGFCPLPVAHVVLEPTHVGRAGLHESSALVG